MANSFGSNGGSSLRNLNNAQNGLSKVFEKLSSGKKINRASDDAAGLAIASQLVSDAAVYKVASTNVSYGQSAIEITDGALSQVADIGARLNELATQSANGTFSDQQRAALNTEYQALSQEVNRIAATTNFNGKALLNGDSFAVQAGDDSSANSQISVNGVNLQQIAANATSQNIGTQAGAQAALASVNSLIDGVSSARGELGAVSSRLETADNVLAVKRETSLAAASRIQDLDVAEAVAQKVSFDIKSQAATAVQAQTNKINADSVLKLLK